MTDPSIPSSGGTEPTPRSNGLLASSYVPLTDLAVPLAPRVLTALQRARIAAYLAELPDTAGALRLYVASGERADARTIVAAVVRSDGGTTPPGTPDAVDDPLAGMDTDAAFAALIADWHVDTHTAIREAERELSREDEDWRLRLQGRDPGERAARREDPAAAAGDDGDADDPTWLDDEHFVPPNPPPLPRPTLPMVAGLLLIIGSILIFSFGSDLGMPDTVRFLLGVAGIVGALVLFVMRLRAYRDEDDDGAVL